MTLDNCTHHTAKYKHLLLTLDDEQDFEETLEGEPDLIYFNYCPFCGLKIDRSWKNATVGQGGECENCPEG